MPFVDVLLFKAYYLELYKHYYTSTKYKNNNYLFNVFLGLDVVIQNMMKFFKLISFKNVAICYSRFLKTSILKTKRFV